MRPWIAEIDEQFEAWELAVDEIRVGVEPEPLIVAGAIEARGGEAAAIDLDQPASWIVEIAGGRIARDPQLHR